VEMSSLLLGINSYSFPDQKTGELIEGVKVRCLTSGQTDKPGVLGYQQTEFPAPYAIAKPLLTVASELLAVRSERPCVFAPVILTGDFQQRGKFTNFVVRSIRHDPDFESA
jgi:uncharacterized protein YwbE